MSAEILTDAKITLASTDLGNLCTSCEINYSAETKETTGFGDGARTFAIGFKNWTVTLNTFDDFADNGLNELLFGWVGTAIAFKARKADTVISATNPEFQGTVLVTEAPVFRASVGEVAGGSITLQGSGTLTRAVA